MPVQVARVRFDALPPFSPVVSRLLVLLNGDNFSMRQAAELINSDPSLAAQILRLANSPLFGLQREVSSLLVAMNLLGIDRVYALVLTAGFRKLAGRAAGWPVSKRIWRHSLATAFLAADLSLEQYRDLSEDYTAGLLHDIGRLVLLATAPEKYSALLDRAEREGREAGELETELFGATHEEVGGEAMRRYGFPDSLVAVARWHHHPHGAQQYSTGVEFLSSCCRTASLSGFSVTSHQEVEMPDDDLCLFLRERMLEVERSLGV